MDAQELIEMSSRLRGLADRLQTLCKETGQPWRLLEVEKKLTEAILWLHEQIIASR